MQAFALSPSLTLRVGMDPFLLVIEKTHHPSTPPLVLRSVLSQRYALASHTQIGFPSFVDLLLKYPTFDFFVERGL